MRKKVLILLGFLILLTFVSVFAQQKAPLRKDIENYLNKTLVVAASPGMDGATTIEILDVQIGKPRKWQLNDGGHPIDGRNTSLWPVKVHYKYRRHFKTRTAVSERQWGYSIFKDAFNEWTMSISSYSGQPADKLSDEPTTIK